MFDICKLLLYMLELGSLRSFRGKEKTPLDDNAGIVSLIFYFIEFSLI